MRRLALALQLARHALGTGCWPTGVVPVGLHELPCDLGQSVKHPRGALSSPRPLSSSNELQPRGSSAILREDDMLSRIMEHHPELEEEMELAFRQQDLASSTAPTPGSLELGGKASHERIAGGAVRAQQDESGPSAEAAAAAQRAADALFDTELAARMVQVTGQRRHTPAPVQGGTGPSFPVRPDGAAAVGPYAPPYDIYDARRGLEQALRRMLAKAGYYKRDLLDPRSLCLLRPAQLVEVCEDCGIPPPKGTPHTELARAVANLVALARQTSNGRGSRLRQPTSFVHSPAGPGSGHLAAHGQGLGEAPLGAGSGGLVAAGLAEMAEEGEEDGTGEGTAEGGGTPLVPPPLAPLPDHQGWPARSARRAQLMQEAHYRQQVLRLIAPPSKISGWLAAARAQDAVVVHPPKEDEGRAALVVATAVSQRHAAACVEAVRWQVSEAIARVRAAAAPGSREAAVLSSLKAPTAAGLGVGSDWVALDAGHAEVHVLTSPARAYYQLEFCFEPDGGQPQPERKAAGAARIQRIRSPTSTSSLTLDTIRADSDGPPEAHRLQQQYEPQTNSDRDVRSFQRVLLRSTTVAGRRGRAREGLGIESSSAGRSGLEGAPDGKGTGGQLEGRSHGGWEDDLGLRRAQAPGREGAPPPAEDGGVPVPGEGCMPRDEGTRPDSARQGRQERRRPLFEET